jgi:hypothetical protein
MAAEEEITRALQDNDVDGIARCLSDDWAVISARGGVGRRKVDPTRRDKVGFLELRGSWATKRRLFNQRNDVALFDIRRGDAEDAGSYSYLF